MKLYDKNKLIYKNGYLFTKKGKLVTCSPNVMLALNTLEEKVQRARFDKKKKGMFENFKTIEAGTFKQASEHEEKNQVKLISDSLLLDAKEKETMKLMDEIELNNMIKEVNELIKTNHALLEFVNDSKILGSTKESHALRFDLYIIGNPLKLTEEKLVEFLAETVGLDFSKFKAIENTGMGINKDKDSATFKL